MKYKFWRNTKAILPTGTRLNPAQPQKNEFHMCWKESTYLLLEQEQWGKAPRQIILAGGGASESYPEVGSVIEAHHDQTLADLGRWTVVGKASHEGIAALHCAKPSAPLYVYK